MGGRMTKGTYGWTNDQSRLRVDGLNTKSPMGGWTIKVTYEWTILLGSKDLGFVYLES